MTTTIDALSLWPDSVGCVTADDRIVKVAFRFRDVRRLSIDGEMGAALAQQRASVLPLSRSDISPEGTERDHDRT